MKTLGYLLLLTGLTSFAYAGSVPEVDPGTACTAFALAGGIVLIVRSHKKASRR